MMTLVLMKEQGIPIDVILFADTGLEFLEMYAYLERVEQYIGMKITRVKADKTFEDIFYQQRIRGKHVGQIHGWPMTRGCWWNDYGKLRPLNKFKKTVWRFP